MDEKIVEDPEEQRTQRGAALDGAHTEVRNERFVLPMNTRSMPFLGRDGLRAVLFFLGEVARGSGMPLLIGHNVVPGRMFANKLACQIR